MQYSQLIERTEKRLPKIWLVNTAVESDKITFEIGYLGDGYGAKNAILVPDGCNYPRYTVTIPSHAQNLPTGAILRDGYFTIEGIIENP